MNTKLLAYFFISSIAFGLYFAALLFFGAVMDLEIASWILILFFLTAGNWTVAIALFAYNTFYHLDDED